MLFQTLIEGICFVFVAITFPIYIFYIIILIKYRNTRELKGTFFQLCISIGVGDIISMVNNYAGYRFPAWGWGTALYLSGGPLLAKTVTFLSWFLRVFQGVGVVMLAVNRAIAIIWPHKYPKLWTSYTLRAAVGLQILFGSAFGVPLLFQKFHWEIDNSTNSAVAKFDDNVFKAKYFAAAFLLEAPVVLLIIVCYVAMFADLRRRNVEVIAQTSQASSHFYRDSVSSAKHIQERKLALMGGIVCAFEIIWFLFVFYTSVITPLSTDSFFLIYNFLTDIYSGVNPYLMFAFCSGVRERIKITLRPKSDTSVVHVRSARPSNVSQMSRVTRLNRSSSTPQH